MADGDGGAGPDAGQPGDKGGEGDAKPEGFKAVTYKTQEELDGAFSERATRAAETARKEALKGMPDGVKLGDVLKVFKAHQEAEEAKKDPATKDRDRADAAERELEKFRAKEARGVLAKEVAGTVKFGETPIPAELLAGDTKEEMQAFAKTMVDFFNNVSGPRQPRYNPDQGQNGDDKVVAGDPIRDFMATGTF